MRETLPLDRETTPVERGGLPDMRGGSERRGRATRSVNRRTSLVGATRPPNDAPLTLWAAPPETHQDAPTSGNRCAAEAAAPLSYCQSGMGRIRCEVGRRFGAGCAMRARLANSCPLTMVNREPGDLDPMIRNDLGQGVGEDPVPLPVTAPVVAPAAGPDPEPAPVPDPPPDPVPTAAPAASPARPSSACPSRAAVGRSRRTPAGRARSRSSVGTGPVPPRSSACRPGRR
jgi:hypothetical protein